MADTLLRAASTNGAIRIFAAETTELVNRAQQIHHTYPIATAALGRLLSAAAMMGAMLKGEDNTLTLRIKGDGPLGGVLAVSNAHAQVKGYVVNPKVQLPSKAPGKLDVGGAVGAGTLSVICDLGLKEPYSAQVALVSGEIAEDITAYYAISEQVPSAVALGVLVAPDGSVIKAGGFILQLMPQATDADAARLEQVIAGLPPVTTMLNDEAMSVEDIIFRVTAGFDVFIFEKERLTPVYRCDCSRERVEKALISMGREEMEKMIAEQDGAELTCQFCDNVYHFTRAELEQLLRSCR